VKTSSAARQPMRKLFKSHSEGSVTSTATKAGAHVVKLAWFSKKKNVHKRLSGMNCTHEESKASWLSHKDGEKTMRQCRKENDETMPQRDQED
jgi:hypothetical protein